uniref:Uncharacterized protein n=1 Tax=Glossina pallidipes TaxID=7398 RepID=A0A1B0AHK7_GLOPL
MASFRSVSFKKKKKKNVISKLIYLVFQLIIINVFMGVSFASDKPSQPTKMTFCLRARFLNKPTSKKRNGLNMTYSKHWHAGNYDDVVRDGCLSVLWKEEEDYELQKPRMNEN